ncbi:uncharacterized protein [Miscanthus floridulus]|uniref:uncharacterized protein n=1 Tax=Miscanthus floridulus TaxID=154761 RepID=UPI00345AF247
MKAYLVGLHPGIWEIVHDVVEPPVDPKNPTPTEVYNIQLNGQATRVLLSALDGDEYNRVMGVEVVKKIWDTLHLTHEGVDKVRKARIDLLMAKLNRDKKKFQHFTPNDVLGRIMTIDMQREEALERMKLSELQAKLDGMKFKYVALKADKSINQASTSKFKSIKQASISKPKAPKQVQEQMETTSSSSEGESDNEKYEEVGDVAIFMKRFQKGLKKEGYKFVKRRFPNKKRTL